MWRGGKKQRDQFRDLYPLLGLSLCTSQWPLQFSDTGAIASPRLNEEERKIPFISQTSNQPYPQPTIPISDVMTTVLRQPTPSLCTCLCLLLSSGTCRVGLEKDVLPYAHSNLLASLPSAFPPLPLDFSNSPPILSPPTCLHFHPLTLSQPTLLQCQFSVEVEN